MHCQSRPGTSKGRSISASTVRLMVGPWLTTVARTSVFASARRFPASYGQVQRKGLMKCGVRATQKW